MAEASDLDAQLLALLAGEPPPEAPVVAAPAPAETPSATLDAALSDVPEKGFTFQDMRLRVGDRIQLQPPAAVALDRYIVKLIGYLDNATLLVTTPTVNGLRVQLRENDKIVARVFTSQNAFGFSSTVERICKIPYEYTHLSFPVDIQSSVIRKAPRVRTRIIASVANPDASERDARQSAVIVNLSADGALVKARQPLCQKGQAIRMSFRINLHNVDALLSVDAVIRSIFRDDEKGGGEAAMVSHGVQFQGLAANDSVILQSMIYQQMIEQPQSLT